MSPAHNESDSGNGAAAPELLPAAASAAFGRIVRNSTLNLTAQGLNVVFNLVVVFTLARTLGKEGLGQYYTVFALVVLVQLVLEGGVATFLTRQVARSPETLAETVANAVGLLAIVMVLSTGTLVGIGYAWGTMRADMSVLPIFAWAGLACAAIHVQHFSAAVFQAFEQFEYESIARVLQGASLALAVAVALRDSGTEGVTFAMAMLAGSHVLAALFLVVSLQWRRRCLTVRFDFKVMKSWLSEAVPVGLSDVFRRLTWQLDTLLLGLMQPPAVVGIYSVAYRPLGPLNWLPRAILTAAFPSFARMAVGDRQALNRAFATSTRLLWITSLPIAIAICACAEPLVLALAGQEFIEAAFPMRILIWITSLSFLSSQFRFLFAAVGKQQIFLRLVTVVLLLEASLEAALIPYWGYLGACAGSLLGEIVFTVVGLTILFYVGVSGIEWRALFSSALAATAMGAMLWLARGAGLPLLVVMLLLSTGTYFALCMLLDALRRDEVHRVLVALKTSFRTGPDVPESYFAGPVSAPVAQANGSHDGRIDFIQSGWRQLDRLQSGTVTSPEPLRSGEVEQALGEPVMQCDLWLAKRDSRIYRVHCAEGRTLVAKQICAQSDAEIAREYESLHSLARMEIPKLHVPRAIALLPAQHTYLTEFSQGESVADMLWRSGRDSELPEACELAGGILARIHAAWTESICPIPVDALARDLETMPGGLSRREHQTVQRALKCLADQPIAVGQPYLDFNPKNVLYHGGTVSLIDPPEEYKQGVLLWDYATFCFGIRRKLWNYTMAQPWHQRRPLAEKSLSAFERGYFDDFPERRPEGNALKLLILVLELQKVGQLMVQRIGWHQRTMLLSNRRRFRSRFSAGLSLSLHKTIKRRIIGQIARQLP